MSDHCAPSTCRCRALSAACRPRACAGIFSLDAAREARIVPALRHLEGAPHRPDAIEVEDNCPRHDRPALVADRLKPRCLSAGVLRERSLGCLLRVFSLTFAAGRTPLLRKGRRMRAMPWTFLILLAFATSLACGSKDEPSKGDGGHAGIGGHGGIGGIGGTAGTGGTPGSGPEGGSGGEGGTSNPGGSGGVELPSCLNLGVACDPAGAESCCSGRCEEGVCTAVAFCHEAGSSCSSSTDCCSNRCDETNEGRRCSDQRCLDVDEDCSEDDDCCTATCTSGKCASIPGGSGCGVLGESCGSGSECCSTNCTDGRCARAYSCQATGDICLGDDECCGGTCSRNDGVAGVCLAVSGGGGTGCNADGNPCTKGTTCCSRICADPGSGVTVCQPASGCRLTGNSCSSDDACCGGGSNPNGSVKCTAGRCDNGQACNPVGNICGADVLPGGGSINASQNCCDGKKDVCKLDSSGIPRCFGGGSTECPTGYTGEQPCCIESGNECQFRDQCCGGAPCIPGEDGRFVCATESCVPAGQGCELGVDSCCGETSCLPAGEFGHVCRMASGGGGGGEGGAGGDGGGGACFPNGESCTSGSLCCSGICKEGVCGRQDICQPAGEVCTASGDCCLGSFCNIPAGSEIGRCEAGMSCGLPGQGCGSSAACCRGLRCLDENADDCADGSSCSCTVILG